MPDHAPYRAELTPEERGRALVKALRALPPDRPAALPGDGDFLWCYSYESIPAGDLSDCEKAVFGAPGGWCGTVGCAVGLGVCLGLLDETSHVVDELGLDHDRRDIFYDAATYGVAWSAVTPAMVADELERALDERYGR